MRPLASSAPKICDGLWSKMRFRASDVVEGCSNLTLWPGATLKLCQFNVARSLRCVTVSRDPANAADAAPSVTQPTPLLPHAAHGTGRSCALPSRDNKDATAVATRLRAPPYRLLFVVRPKAQSTKQKGDGVNRRRP